MKTPKQYAKNLVNKFFNTHKNRPIVMMTNDYATQLALISVNQTLAIFKGMDDPEKAVFDALGKRQYKLNEPEYDTHLHGYDMEEYFKQVKKEIKKSKKK